MPRPAEVQPVREAAGRIACVERLEPIQHPACVVGIAPQPFIVGCHRFVEGGLG